MHDDAIALESGEDTETRKLESNFKHVRFILYITQPESTCGSNTKPVMLDMGAGVGSVAAAMAD